MEFRLQRWSTDELRAENRACVFREADSETNIDRRHLTAERVNTRLPRREDCGLVMAARCAAVSFGAVRGSIHQMVLIEFGSWRPSSWRV